MNIKAQMKGTVWTNTQRTACLMQTKAFNFGGILRTRSIFPRLKTSALDTVPGRFLHLAVGGSNFFFTSKIIVTIFTLQVINIRF